MLNMFNLIKHRIVPSDGNLPPFPDGCAYEYWLAGNGVFIRAENDFVYACIPVAPAKVRGLPDIEASVYYKLPPLPGDMLQEMVSKAQVLYHDTEVLFQVTHNSDGYTLHPAQVGSRAEIIYNDVDGKIVLDLHSHHMMQCYFSATDNAHHNDLRFYAVIGRTDLRQPHFRLRFSAYGHFYNLPATALFDDASCVTDLVAAFGIEGPYQPSRPRPPVPPRPAPNTFELGKRPPAPPLPPPSLVEVPEDEDGSANLLARFILRGWR